MADKGRYKENDPLLACDLPIDQPDLLVHDELVLSGWAASAHGIAGVAVRIDGDRQLQASYGLDSPWVAETIPDMPGAEAAAYELRLDTSEWAAGGHAIEIVATDGRGRSATISGQVEVAPFEHPRYTVEDNRAAIAAGEPAMWLEEPRIVDGVPELNGALEVSGWAYSRQGIESVNVTLDRRDRRQALRPISRTDLLADYGREVAAEAGFVLHFDPAELAPGTHEVSVVAVARDGQAVGVEGRVICPHEPPPSDGRGPLELEWLAEREAPRLRHRTSSPAAEVERQLRYRWAAAVAGGKTVLETGSGEASAELFSRAGAQRVESAAGDLRDLPFGDASFDLIACFDTIDRVPEPAAALEELRRVLRPDGALLISAPSELDPESLERTVRDCFAYVAVHRPRPSSDTVAVAGHGPLPRLEPIAFLASAEPFREALGSALMWEDRARLAEADAAASRTEANLAQMHQKGLVGKLSEAEARARSLEALEASLSWRITRPLRALKRRLGSRSAAQ